MNWLEYIVVGIIIFFGLASIYKALHEPLDWVVNLIRKGVDAIKDRTTNRTEGGYDTINYG